MTKPDANSPDPGTNPDDAAWLDLVSRLESGTGESEPTTIAGETDNPPGRSFRDFDPLGLSAPAPTEPSAQERNPPRQSEEAGGADHDLGTDDGRGGPRDYELDDDEGFVPEEPPSLAGIDPLTMLAWLGAVGGPIALLLSAMFWRSAPLLAILGIVAVFVVSVIYLIMKLPTDKDEYDDGARV